MSRRDLAMFGEDCSRNHHPLRSCSESSSSSIVDLPENYRYRVDPRQMERRDLSQIQLIDNKMKELYFSEANRTNAHHQNYPRQFPAPPTRIPGAPEGITPPRTAAQQKLLIERLANLSRLSNSMDQGYHTLIMSSNSSLTQIPTTTLIPPNIPFIRAKTTFPSGPYFNLLNDDIVLKILSFLDTSLEVINASGICKRFETLCWNPKLWKSIHLQGEHICGDKMLKTIFKRLLSGQMKNPSLIFIERIYISNNCKVTDKGLGALSRRCPELTHLQIQLCQNVTNSGISEVITKCTNLQHLDITGCPQITSLDLSSNDLSQRRFLIQYLDLTDCTMIDDTSLQTIVRNCPQLVYLYLRRCVQITDAGLKFVPSFCVMLRELSISDCINITDFGLYELAKLGATLRYLSVAKCDQVSDAGLKVLARCYKLRYLNTRGCEAVSDDSIIVLARSCPRLRALDISRCDVSDTGLRALAESCPNLKKLSVRNCDMITDKGIHFIAYYCRGLQQLNIQDCQITLEGYRAVKMYCKRCVIEHSNPGFC